jgi:hypothetical protein
LVFCQVQFITIFGAVGELCPDVSIYVVVYAVWCGGRSDSVAVVAIVAPVLGLFSEILQKQGCTAFVCIRDVVYDAVYTFLETGIPLFVDVRRNKNVFAFHTMLGEGEVWYSLAWYVAYDV